MIDGIDVTRLPEHKRAKYLGRVFQDPMTGTAATMAIDENMAIAARRGQRRTLRWGITRKERAHYCELLKSLDLGLESRMAHQGGAFIRRPASGHYPFNGSHSKAKAAAAG